MMTQALLSPGTWEPLLYLDIIIARTFTVQVYLERGTDGLDFGFDMALDMDSTATAR